MTKKKLATKHATVQSGLAIIYQIESCNRSTFWYM